MKVALRPVEAQRVALEVKAEAMAHHTVGAIAGHQKGIWLDALRTVGLPQAGGEAIVVLLETEKLDAEIGLNAVGSEVTPQHGFGFVLRHHQRERIGRRHRVERKRCHGPAARQDVGNGDLVTHDNNVRRRAGAVEKLQRARPHRDRPRGARRFRNLVDDADRNAITG
ncbi:MAG: hypothetical protein WAS21_03360 [Geminicoccaceae bacterium]